ncbi:MAG: FtsX-like permease family protein [Acidobacteria bacterium]|nr:FtsX-like permease family protein [Acidobacteriota bacterium]
MRILNRLVRRSLGWSSPVLPQDVRYALRALRKNPVFAVVATITLALGIGAVTAIFTVVNAVLVRPLPYTDPDQLVMVWERNEAQGIERSEVSPGALGDWREQNVTFDGLAGFWPNSLTLRDREDTPIRVKSALVTTDFFPLLGASAAQGRVFSPEEGLPGGSGYVVLSDGLWRRTFGGEADIIGNTITIEENPVVVIGIMPPEFAFPQDVEMWTNVNFPLQGRFGRWMNVVGRMKPEVELPAATGDMRAVAGRIASEFPTSNSGWGVTLADLHSVVVGDTGPALLVLLGATAAVLLIACANVANLLLTQSEIRHREMAVRAALGAGRGRLIRQLLTESIVLACGGTILGLGLAWASLRGLVALGPAGLPRLTEISIDGTVLAVTAAATVFTGLIFGLAPAIRLIRADLQVALREGAKGSVGADRLRLRNLFVVGQLALATILVIGAGLLLRSFAAMQATDPGFSAESTLTLQLNLSNQAYPNDEDVAQFYGRLLDQLGEMPGVASAGMSSALPMGESLDYLSTFLIADQPPPEAGEQLRSYFRQVDEGFFQTLGIGLRDGRGFERTDDGQAPGVVVVNQAFASQFFPDSNPLEEKLTNTAQRFGPLGAMLFNEVEIVGIVDDVMYEGLRADPAPTVYFPHRQAPFRLMNVALRSDRDPRALIGGARDTLQQLDSSIPVSRTETMSQIVAASLSADRFSMLLAGAFGAMALLLASVGIYGVLSYTVQHRAKELGIRMALGADSGSVRSLVMRHGATLTAISLGIGLIGALWLTRFMASQLYGVNPSDPVTFVAVTVILGSIAALACWVPVRRATRLDPVVALREE